MARLHWFKIYPAELLADERFQGWTMAERGAWLTLIACAWREGSIPAEEGQLCRLLHVDAVAMRSHWSAIGDRFEPHPDLPGRLVSPRLEAERAAGEALAAKRGEAGKAGASARWNWETKAHGKRMAGARNRSAPAMRLDAHQDQDQDQKLLLGAAASINASVAAAPKDASTAVGETPAAPVKPAGAPGDAKGTSHRKPEIGAGTPRPPGDEQPKVTRGLAATPDPDLGPLHPLPEVHDLAPGAPPPRWPLLLQFRLGVAEGLARPSRSFPFPRGDDDCDELEAHLARVGVDAAISRCVELAKDRAGQGRIGALGYFLPVLRDVPSRTPVAAAAPPLAPAGCLEWEEAREQLRAHARPDFFDRWLAPVIGRVEGSTLVLRAPSAGHAAFLRDEHLPTLRAAVTLRIANVVVEAASAAA